MLCNGCSFYNSSRFSRMSDKTPLVGLGGTLGSFSLGTINDILGIACGVVTLVYLGYRLYKEIKGLN